MEAYSTPIKGLKIISPRVFSDSRGSFCELWRVDDDAGSLVDGCHFVQDNVSWSVKNTLRGLHFQVAPFAQGKLVSVLHGVIFDVAVDLRESSPTFGQHFSIRLSSEDKQMLWVPEGFAHGFLALSEVAAVLYKTTNFYSPNCEGSIRWNDPQLSIPWPLPSGCEPILSAKDTTAPLFRETKPLSV